MEETKKSECFVDEAEALLVLQVVGNPEVLKELKELQSEEKQNTLSSASALHRRHFVLDIPGDEEA